MGDKGVKIEMTSFMYGLHLIVSHKQCNGEKCKNVSYLGIAGTVAIFFLGGNFGGKPALI